MNVPLDIQILIDELRSDIRGMASPWMTRNEAAAFLKVDPSTINKLVGRGKLQKYELSDTGTPRFNREDIEALIQKAK